MDAVFQKNATTIEFDASNRAAKEKWK